jgi:hypothetical protein
VDVLTYQLPHQVVLGALLPPSQAPQLLSGALRPGDIRTGLKYDCCTIVYSVFETSVWEISSKDSVLATQKRSAFYQKAGLELGWILAGVI